MVTFWEFFFQTIIAGNLSWPSHLSSAKCLNIRHKDCFIPSSLRIWDFDGRIAKCAWFWWWVLFHVGWDLQFRNLARRRISIFRMIRDVKNHTLRNMDIFTKRAVLRPSTKNRAGPHSFFELIRIFFLPKTPVFFGKTVVRSEARFFYRQ